MRKLLCVAVVVCAGVGGFVFFPGEVGAIPAFARNYKTSCITCHTMTPRLNAFGEAVRLNGFRWPEADPEKRVEKDREMRKEEPVLMGQEAYKRVWPKAVWPSDIPGTLPLAIRNRTTYEWEPGGDGIDELVWEWEVLTAGSMGEDFSAFGHFNIEGEIQSFEDAQDKEKVKTKLVGFLQWENLGWITRGDEDLINLQLGIVGVEEHDLLHYRSHSTNRINDAKAFYTEAQVPYPDTFREKNRYKLRRGPGTMLYGFTPRLLYNLGYQVGNQEGGGTDQNVGFLSVAYKFGGMDHYGRTEDKYTHGHQEDSLSIGLFASVGEADVQASKTAFRKKDEFWRLGPDARWRWKDFALHVGTVFGSNENPYGTLNPDEVDVMSWFVAPEYYVFPWLMVATRYEQEDVDVPADMELGDRERDRIVPMVHVLARANIRFTLEASFFTDERHDAAGNKLDSDSVAFTIDFTW